MFDTFEDPLKKKLEGGHCESQRIHPEPPRRHLFFFFFFTGVRTPDRRPDAVSTVLICPDRIELYGVQQLSGAVAPLEEKQKR